MSSVITDKNISGRTKIFDNSYKDMLVKNCGIDRRMAEDLLGIRKSENYRYSNTSEDKFQDFMYGIPNIFFVGIAFFAVIFGLSQDQKNNFDLPYTKDIIPKGDISINVSSAIINNVYNPELCHMDSDFVLKKDGYNAICADISGRGILPGDLVLSEEYKGIKRVLAVKNGKAIVTDDHMVEESVEVKVSDINKRVIALIDLDSNLKVDVSQKNCPDVSKYCVLIKNHKGLNMIDYFDTHSMEPMMGADSTGIIEEINDLTGIQVGDVVAYNYSKMSKKHTVSHKVVDIDKGEVGYVYTFKGLNNYVKDPYKINRDNLEYKTRVIIY